MADADTADARIKKVFETLWNDPDVGEAIQKKTKAIYPDAKTNEDVLGPVVAPLRAENEKLAKRLAEITERLEARDKAAEESATKRSLEDALNSARSNYNLTDEGFDKMVARMRETGNYADAEAAAAWVASKAPPAPVKGPTWAPQKLNLFGTGKKDDSFAELHRDPMDFLDSQLSQFVADPEAYRIETARMFGEA